MGAPAPWVRTSEQPRDGAGAEGVQLAQVEQPGLVAVHPVQHAGEDLRRLPDEVRVPARTWCCGSTLYAQTLRRAQLHGGSTLGGAGALRRRGAEQRGRGGDLGERLRIGHGVLGAGVVQLGDQRGRGRPELASPQGGLHELHRADRPTGGGAPVDERANRRLRHRGGQLLALDPGGGLVHPRLGGDCGQGVEGAGQVRGAHGRSRSKGSAGGRARFRSTGAGG